MSKFQECHFPLSLNFNIDFLRQESENNTDRDVIDFLQFGFPIPCNHNLLNSVLKWDSTEHRIIISWREIQSMLQFLKLPTLGRLQEPFHLTFPSVVSLIAMVKHKGYGCALYKPDLQRAYRQISVDPGDIHNFFMWCCPQVWDWLHFVANAPQIWSPTLLGIGYSRLKII